MFIVGLTGGIASGKSEAATIFRKLGARVIDADEISRDLMLPHTECWEKVTAVFGKEILTDDLSINRALLASIVFADQQKRLLLNSLVHPAIMHTIEDRIALIQEEEPDALVIIDAALLVETGIYKRCDKVVVICAAESSQIKRLLARDKMSPGEARKRIAAQLPLAEKVAVADYLINNDGSLQALQNETKRAFQSLHACQSSKIL